MVVSGAFLEQEVEGSLSWRKSPYSHTPNERGFNPTVDQGLMLNRKKSCRCLSVNERSIDQQGDRREAKGPCQ